MQLPRIHMHTKNIYQICRAGLDGLRKCSSSIKPWPASAGMLLSGTLLGGHKHAGTEEDF